MDTFELLPSLAQGELQDTSAPELVASVFRSRASGTLWLETPQSAEIRVFFRAGDMCGTGPFEGFQTLAHVLLANEWVDALDIDSSREEAATNRQRHGEVLVAKGLLTPEQLRAALVAQHTTNLTLVLAMPQGRYDWRGWEPPPPWAREVVVDPVAALTEAFATDLHAARRRKVIEWLGPHAARLALDWPDIQGRIQLGPVERRAAALLALPRKLDEFVQASRLEQVRAEALLVALLLCGGVEPQPIASAPPPPREVLEPLPPEVQPEPEPEPLLEPLPEVALEPELKPLAPDEELGEPELHEAVPAPPKPRAAVAEDEAIQRLESLSLDEAASAPAAPPVVQEEESLEIDHDRAGQKHAAGTNAAMHHAREEPTFEAAPAAPVEPSFGSDEQVSADMRRKMRARSLRAMGSGSATPVQTAAVQGGAVEEQAAPAASLDVSQLSGDERVFVEEVRIRVKRGPLQNAYVRLGLTPEATGEQIKKAYLDVAKRFHPDRAQGRLAALLPELQTVFRLLKDAYEQISSPVARDKYDKQLKAGGKPSRKEDSVTAVKMGEVLLKKRDFDGAINKLRHAVDLDGNGDAMAALAWALVSDPKSTNAIKEEAAKLIQSALRAPGLTARAYYVAGVLWRTKDPDSAVDAFRKALELDPNHPDAPLELRLIEQRRGKQAKGGGVLSGLLFGKRKS